MCWIRHRLQYVHEGDHVERFVRLGLSQPIGWEHRQLTTRRAHDGFLRQLQSKTGPSRRLTERQERAISATDIKQPTGRLPIQTKMARDTLKHRVAIRRGLGLAVGLVVIFTVKLLDYGSQWTRIQKYEITDRATHIASSRRVKHIDRHRLTATGADDLFCLWHGFHLQAAARFRASARTSASSIAASKIAVVFATIWSTVNRSCTTARPSAPIFRAAVRSPNTSRIAFARAWESRDGTSNPVLWSSINSGTPLTRDATTGQPMAIASNRTNGNPSDRDGNTTTSAAARISAMSSRTPTNRQACSTASSLARLSSSSASSPSPTHTQQSCGQVSSRQGSACTR